jgi:hypothetical protein
VIDPVQVPFLQLPGWGRFAGPWPWVVLRAGPRQLPGATIDSMAKQVLFLAKQVLFLAKQVLFLAVMSTCDLETISSIGTVQEPALRQK